MNRDSNGEPDGNTSRHSKRRLPIMLRGEDGRVLESSMSCKEIVSANSEVHIAEPRTSDQSQLDAPQHGIEIEVGNVKLLPQQLFIDVRFWSRRHLSQLERLTRGMVVNTHR